MNNGDDWIEFLEHYNPNNCEHMISHTHVHQKHSCQKSIIPCISSRMFDTRPSLYVDASLQIWFLMERPSKLAVVMCWVMEMIEIIGIFMLMTYIHSSPYRSQDEATLTESHKTVSSQIMSISSQNGAMRLLCHERSKNQTLHNTCPCLHQCFIGHTL